MVADRQSHAALPERVPGDCAGHLALEDGLDRELDAVDAGHRHLAGTPIGTERFDRSQRHVVIRGPDAGDLIAELGEPGIGLVQCLGRRPVRDLHIEQLDVRVGLERLFQSGLAFDRRHVRLDAAERDNAALAAHRLDQGVGHGLAIGDAAERDMCDVVRVEIPRMQVGGLVPLRYDIGAGCLGSFDDRTRVRAVVGVDVDHAVAAGLGEYRLDVGDALLAVALGHQRHIFGADRLGEGCAAIVPGRMIGVRQRADRVDDRRLVLGEARPGNDCRKCAGRAEQGSAFQEFAPPERTLQCTGNDLPHHCSFLPMQGLAPC